MRKWTKILAIIMGVVIMASLAVGSVAVFAADPQPTTTPAATGTATHDLFLSKLAAKLNVTVDQLEAAFTKARTDTINQLAADGQISDAQKEWMLERAEEGFGARGGICGGMTGSGFGAGMRSHGRGSFSSTAPWNQASTTPTK
jgi:hypothetical protein